MNKKIKQIVIKNMKKIFVTLLGISISHFAAALSAFANIGQGPFTAFCLMSSYLTGIKMGTLLILFQIIFLAGQLFIQKGEFKPIQLLQILIVVFGGGVLNFFLYHVFQSITITSYFLRVLLGNLSFACNAIGVIMVLEADFIRIPLEGFLQLIAEARNETLGKYRKAFDIFLIILNIAICMIAGFKSTIREGTIMNAIVFGTFLDLMKCPINQIYRRFKVA